MVERSGQLSDVELADCIRSALSDFNAALQVAVDRGLIVTRFLIEIGTTHGGKQIPQLRASVSKEL